MTNPTWGPINTRYLLSGLSPPIRKELGPICCSKYSLARITLFTRRFVSSGLYGEKPSGEGALRGGVILPLWNFTILFFFIREIAHFLIKKQLPQKVILDSHAAFYVLKKYLDTWCKINKIYNKKMYFASALSDTHHE